ncbi:MAG: nucleotidyltransferase domain-containing protein [Firmicutes bacterium]|nr:nucleotidyltransferase domain-containing protein [Bacillota bacterium]
MENVYTANQIKEKLLPVFDASPVEKAILFGSYAKGNQTRVSDVDIFIDSKGKIKGIDFFGVLQDITEALHIPVDLIEASQVIHGGRIDREIAETGIIIYERA